MSISCHLYGQVAKAAGHKSLKLEFSGMTVGDLIEKLISLYPNLADLLYTPTREISVQVNILVNGHSIKLLKGRETPLRAIDDVKIDRIDIIETVGGGKDYK
ncbi:MAG: MoaD/ThiS family protein [Candidatus Hodarchaeales archaeon]|jgi:molybdopterin converting factor small subunit